MNTKVLSGKFHRNPSFPRRFASAALFSLACAAAVAKPFPDTAKWRFNPHLEHPGAKGSLAVTNGIYSFDYDFTGGGHGISADFTLREPLWADRISVDARLGRMQRLGICVTDSRNQTFFKAAGASHPGEWHRHVCDLSGNWQIHWGGPNDGAIFPPFKSVSVSLDRMTKGVPGPGETGRAFIRNICYDETPPEKRVTSLGPTPVRYTVTDFSRGADRFSAGPRRFFIRKGDYRQGGISVDAGIVTNDFAARPHLMLCSEIPVWGRPAEFLLTVEAPAEAAGLQFAMDYRSNGSGSVTFGTLRKALPGEKTVVQTFSAAGPGGEGWTTQKGKRAFNPSDPSRRLMHVNVRRGSAPAKTFALRLVKLEAVVRSGIDLPPLLATPPAGEAAPRELEVGFLNLDDKQRADAEVRVTMRDWENRKIGMAVAKFPPTVPGARSSVKVALPAVDPKLNYVQFLCEAYREGRRDMRVKMFETSWTRPWAGEGTVVKRPDLPWGFGVYIHRSEAWDAFASGYETPTNAASLARMEQRASLARKAGIKWERVELKPSQVEFVKGTYDFSAIDRILETMDRNGLVPCMCCSHYWPGGYKPYSKEAMDEWAKVIGLAAARYRGRCLHWELWNEVNISFWTGTMEEYVYMANATYDAIKRVAPESQVHACSTAGVDVKCMDECLKLGLKCDSISIHPYRAEPIEERYLADLASATNRTRGAKMMLTELGWPTGCDTYTYAERTQAGYYVRNYLTSAGSGMATAIYGYNFVDDGFNLLERENNFGILRRDLTPKPAYRAIATLCNFFTEGEARLESKEINKACRAWIFRMGGKAAVWSSAPAQLSVRCSGKATARNPMDETLGSGSESFSVRTDGTHAVFFDRDIVSVDGVPAPGEADAVVEF